MSRWPGKYVIGLTGNIGTGKSVVRKMLEHQGAFGLDADALAHQASAKGGPAYAQIVKLFGEWILGEEGEINRARLSHVVFAFPDTLAKLEAILHPVVGQAVDFLVKRTKANVVVVEAIKLLEAGLAKDCDAVWVVNVPEAVQIARLVEKRNLSEEEALQRLQAQSPQSEKLKAASVVIDNSGTFEDAWTQVQAAFGKIMQPAAPTPPTPAPSPSAAGANGKVVKIRRGSPRDAAAIAEFIKQVTNGARVLSRADVIAAFGDKAYMLGDYGDELAALAGWKVENLVARVDEFFVGAGAPLDKLAPPLIEAVENASRELQCEAALIFVPLSIAQNTAQALAGNGYAPQTGDKLGVAAWKDAVKESMPPNTGMLFKKLREDRVLKPI
jgi:dephospho-CoA kinase